MEIVLWGLCYSDVEYVECVEKVQPDGICAVRTGTFLMVTTDVVTTRYILFPAILGLFSYKIPGFLCPPIPAGILITLQDRNGTIL